MLNFTMGPVMSSQSVLDVSANSSPYFRTPEFSEIMFENERLMLDLLNAPKGSRCVFLTASGTGAMESCVMNVLSPKERVIVVNGGSFGQRFVDLCNLHDIDVQEAKVDFGCQLHFGQLDKLADCGATALLVNAHETSSGLLYDMPMIARFCKACEILLIVDAVSSFIADDLDMTALGADAVIAGSQKALALHPGVSIVALSSCAQERVRRNTERCLYLSLKEALKNGSRGQTPWTPAVTTLMQLNVRLKDLADKGLVYERSEIANRAMKVRDSMLPTGLRIVAESPSNAVTAFKAAGHAKWIVRTVQEKHGIWLCPNSGALADDVFRVGHIGAISHDDNQMLISALQDVVGSAVARGQL